MELDQNKLKLDEDSHVISDYCFICGHYHQGPIDQDDDCGCCGIHINFWSRSPRVMTVTNYRNNWFEYRNCHWESKYTRPKVCNKELAIAQIKQNVPEEFWNNDPNVTKKPAIIVKPQEPAETVKIDTQKNSSIFKTLYALIKKVFLKH
jgi:hypothetical protein